MPSTTDVPPPASEPVTVLTYRWLIALGFPPEVAAASLMPDVFTDKVRPPEVRPGRIGTAS